MHLLLERSDRLRGALDELFGLADIEQRGGAMVLLVASQLEGLNAGLQREPGNRQLGIQFE